MEILRRIILIGLSVTINVGCSEFPERQKCTSNAICGKEFRCDVNSGRCVTNEAVGITSDGGGISAADQNVPTDATVVTSITPCPETTVELDGITWQCVEGGTFQMGSNDYADNTRPVHQVEVPSFWMSKSEVTVTQYRACVLDGGCDSPSTGGETFNFAQPERDDHPINGVSFDQATQFAEFVGDGARLPSEAEWEFAARSRGQTPNLPWSAISQASSTCNEANIWEVDDGDAAGCNTNATMTVCSIETGNSAQGICDLVGNVSEWTQDYYRASYDCDLYRDADECRGGGQAPIDGSAWLTDTQTRKRVYRGGAWSSDAADANALHRRGDGQDRQKDNLGIRLVRTL